MRFLALVMLAMTTASTFAAEPVTGDFTLPAFTFHTGETLPLRQHYTTLGDPKNPAVLVLHGTGGSGAGLLNANFGGQLFGPGQPLDAAKYYIILPDCIGAGKTSKPSDGLRAKFPRYNYDDMVAAQLRLLTEHLHVKHLRLVLGNSMGGMLAWDWGVIHPDFMDGLVPLASQPIAMASRNWMMRKLVIETIKADPAYNNGNYTGQPPSLKYAGAFFSIGTSGGTLGWQARAGTHAAADKAVDDMLAGPNDGDANDTIWQMDASRDYDPVPKLGAIQAAVLAINSADDERNPVEVGSTPRAVAGLKNAKFYLIPASAQTRGHGTTGQASLWKDELTAWLATVPIR
ncbi:MAG: metX 2 [Alphaproteobacteria bacterium]|nr:metX 2 [Alphaproteobacteria bacterium]